MCEPLKICFHLQHSSMQKMPDINLRVLIKKGTFPHSLQPLSKEKYSKATKIRAAARVYTSCCVGR